LGDVPAPGAEVALYFLDCIGDQSAHLNRHRCGPRGSLPLSEAELPPLPLDRAQKCYALSERDPPGALVAWANGGFLGPTPLHPPAIVVLRLLVNTHTETVAGIGCENDLGPGCDPLAAYQFDQMTRREAVTRAAMTSPDHVNGFTWLPSLSSVLDRQHAALWLQPMILNAQGRRVADPRFVLDRTDDAPLDARAQSVQRRLEQIDGARESLDVRAALAVDLAVAALVLDDRERLKALEQRLKAVSEELGPDSPPNASAPFGRHQVTQMLRWTEGALRGTVTTRDPCGDPGP
jgi:hypothetical protein